MCGDLNTRDATTTRIRDFAQDCEDAKAYEDIASGRVAVRQMQELEADYTELDRNGGASVHSRRRNVRAVIGNWSFPSTDQSPAWPYRGCQAKSLA